MEIRCVKVLKFRYACIFYQYEISFFTINVILILSQSVYYRDNVGLFTHTHTHTHTHEYLRCNFT